MRKDIKIDKTAIIKHPTTVHMEDHVAIDPFFYMTTSGTFGKWIHINSHVSVIGGIDAELFIEDNVAISTGCRLICRSNDFTKPGHAIPFKKDGQTRKSGYTIVLEEGAILGANVVVLPDITIGKGARIGAGSVVTKDVPANQIWAGVPAKKIGVVK